MCRGYLPTVDQGFRNPQIGPLKNSSILCISIKVHIQVEPPFIPAANAVLYKSLPCKWQVSFFRVPRMMFLQDGPDVQ